jgi:hypothetical protein
LRNFGLKISVVSMIGYEARIRHLVKDFGAWRRSSSRC